MLLLLLLDRDSQLLLVVGESSYWHATLLPILGRSDEPPEDD